MYNKGVKENNQYLIDMANKIKICILKEYDENIGKLRSLSKYVAFERDASGGIDDYILEQYEMIINGFKKNTD